MGHLYFVDNLRCQWTIHSFVDISMNLLDAMGLQVRAIVFYTSYSNPVHLPNLDPN